MIAQGPRRTGHPDTVGPTDVLAGPGGTDGSVADDGPLLSRRSLTLVVSGALVVVLVLVMVLLPLPYAVEGPGPTVNTLAEIDGKPIITVKGAETYPTGGELRLTTVSVLGGPGHPVTAARVLAGWLSSSAVVLPREAVFPEGSTRESVDKESSAQMTSSQTNATVAALEELGYDVPMVLTVDGTAPGSGAEGALLRGDVITSVRPDGAGTTQVRTFSELAAVLATTAAGTTVAVGVERDGEPRTVDITTIAHPRTGDGHEPAGSILGVRLVPDVTLPVDISFDIDNIGGPSAGTMFALGIIDTLTPGEMTGGKAIAGTGTMDLSGTVGPIGGIQLKLIGAERDGARWFLAPADNCAEVVGHVPDGLHVVKVATLAEARDAVEAIGAGEGGELPTCTAGRRAAE
ncbi:PDZ domain-containing protein [Georgenia sp. SYP-B2076]|uniref:YlbL family protein n=1 Tax=Georgenia sp. SYP-B2076 TaxID=2495881 RepID=UPI000F8CBEBE|nr:S16 family serine protease [Georgenia sp. SYP-B2076]